MSSPLAEVENTSRLSRIDPVLMGTACCVLAALCYTAANVSMRYLAQLHAEPGWAVAVKEAVTVAVVAPWLVFAGWMGRVTLPGWKMLGYLALTGLAVQLGNLAVQWSYGVVGLGITMSAIFAVMLISAALMSWGFLGETITLRSTMAIGLLMASIVLLYLGAGQLGIAGRSAQGAPMPLGRVLLGVAAACAAGFTFALLSIALRHAGGAGVPAAVIVVIITGMGVLMLGSASVARLGLEAIRATRADQLALMIAAGLFNLAGFFSITIGLRHTTVVHANVLNAGQVAMGAVAGIALFGEAYTPSLLLGTVLSIAGIVLAGKR